MKIKVKGFITSKKSELYSDCADNYAINKEHNKFAISDGVSKSFFPKVWSDILVNKYVSQKDSENEEFINECQKEWQSMINTIVSQPETKWFTKSQYSRKDPALATFVGLQFNELEQKWNAQAQGDSFLFFIQKDSNKIEVQLSSKVEPVVFDNFPDYFSSIGISHRGNKVIKEGTIIEGIFYLMTDALAEWFLSDTRNAIEVLSRIKTQEQFTREIETERTSNRLNDDDSAVLIIELEDDNKKELVYTNLEITYLSELIKKQEEENKVPKIEEINSQISSNTILENNKEVDHLSKSNFVTQVLEDIDKPSEQIKHENNDQKKEEVTIDDEDINQKEEYTGTNTNLSDEKQKEEILPEHTPDKTEHDPKTQAILDKF